MDDGRAPSTAHHPAGRPSPRPRPRVSWWKAALLVAGIGVVGGAAITAGVGWRSAHITAFQRSCQDFGTGGHLTWFVRDGRTWEAQVAPVWGHGDRTLPEAVDVVVRFTSDTTAEVTGPDETTVEFRPTRVGEVDPARRACLL